MCTVVERRGDSPGVTSGFASLLLSLLCPRHGVASPKRLNFYPREGGPLVLRGNPEVGMGAGSWGRQQQGRTSHQSLARWDWESRTKQQPLGLFRNADISAPLLLLKNYGPPCLLKPYEIYLSSISDELWERERRDGGETAPEGA